MRAESCRRALALPAVPADLRARLLAQLFYNLMVAVRLPEAQQLLPDVRKAVEATGDTAARYTQKLTEAALLYLDGHFGTALAMIDASLSGGATELPQGQLARHLRCRILAEEDRFGEALAEVTEGIRSAQQARQARAVQLFEANRARQLLQLGQLADAAAALEGGFSLEDAHLVDRPDADAVVVLGRVALHTADQRQTGLTSAVARGMLGSGVPGVERHAAWLLALQAMATGDPLGGAALADRGGRGGTPVRLSALPAGPGRRPAARPHRSGQRGHRTGRVGHRRGRAAPGAESRCCRPWWPARPTPGAC